MDIRVFTVAWPVIEREPAVVLLSVGLDLLAPAPLFEHLTFARKHWAKTSQPARQPVRQEAIQQRSKGLLAMIYALFRNAEWVQGTLLLWKLTEWTLLAFFLCDVFNMVIVKMWCYFLTLMSHGTSIALTCRQRRKWITVQPQSEVLVSLRLETESWATCWRLVARQKWKTLICITARLNHSKQKFLSYFYIWYDSECLCQF